MIYKITHSLILRLLVILKINFNRLLTKRKVLSFMIIMFPMSRDKERFNMMNL